MPGVVPCALVSPKYRWPMFACSGVHETSARINMHVFSNVPHGAFALVRRQPNCSVNPETQNVFNTSDTNNAPARPLRIFGVNRLTVLSATAGPA